ncbi:hypothetical protein Q31b_19440 [Novipirellula aureliae]|uniref:Uncharacterized protein n=1 Tax=Novipirellula aureliae TaxID=2527966 RepID=A0A5C6E6E5_9BACT|nr:hypothetical protein [Novipirellula aureliae]TWU44408.1 hypothetical protein Q31b_19440 [Novipirellula aureliae]
MLLRLSVIPEEVETFGEFRYPDIKTGRSTGCLVASDELLTP